ncbi:MAG: hypothetical protein AB1779_10845 [Candidatus Thermoplasmatota archaeon]
MATLKDIESLMTLADKLFHYKFNLSYAYSFFALSSIFAGGFLLLIATGLIENPYFRGIGIIVFVVVGVAVLHIVFLETFKKAKQKKFEGACWMLSFFIPYAIIFPLAGALDSPAIFFTSGFLWYIALGIALSLVAILVEDWYVKMKMLFARPFLITGSIIILTSPLLLIVERFSYEHSGNVLGIGLMLLAFFATGSWTLVKAENVFR